MNFGRKGTYESIEESEVMQNKYDSQYGSDVDQSSNIKEKILKYSIIFLFGLAIILIIIMILYKGKKQNFNVKQNINISQQPISDKITNEKENNDIVVNTNNKFSDIFPKTCIKDLCNNISNLNELFESRRLFIDDNNITNEYIRFIRPINETEEESYKKKLYPNLTLDNYHKSTKEGKISVIDFYQICNKPEIINSNITEAPYNPAISVIIPSYNKKNNLTLTLNSVIIQTLKNIEIKLLTMVLTMGVKIFLNFYMKKTVVLDYLSIKEIWGYGGQDLMDFFIQEGNMFFTSIQMIFYLIIIY